MTVGNKPKQLGFTMVELLITMGLVSILAMLAAPSFAQYIKQERLVTTANQLSSVYRYARSEAVKRAQTVTLAKQNETRVVRSLMVVLAQSRSRKRLMLLAVATVSVMAGLGQV